MKKQVKASKMDWSDPEPSDEEDNNEGSVEISSDEELRDDAEPNEVEAQSEPTALIIDSIQFEQLADSLKRLRLLLGMMEPDWAIHLLKGPVRLGEVVTMNALSEQPYFVYVL